MIAIVRLRGEIKTRHKIEDTFRIMGMKKVYSAAVLDDNPVNMGMVKKLNDFAAWGEANEETIRAIGNVKGLKAPKGGLKSKKLHYPRGNLGYCGAKINDLIKKMV